MRTRSFVLIALLCPGFISAQAIANSHVLLGKVMGPQKEAVGDAEVLLLHGADLAFASRTDSAGHFAFRQLAPSSYTITVRRLGYKPLTLASMSTSAEPASARDYVLEVNPAELTEMTVAAHINESMGRLREFYAHRDRAQFGYFFDPEAVAKKKPRHLSELMRAVPGANLSPGRIGNVVRLRGCRPPIWIDGMRTDNMELDESVNVNDVLALEVYSSFAGIPPQYVDRRTNCGAVVVWLKS